eukprot:1158802-Pelagomonas_calceolata.AAC.5
MEGSWQSIDPSLWYGLLVRRPSKQTRSGARAGPPRCMMPILCRRATASSNTPCRYRLKKRWPPLMNSSTRYSFVWVCICKRKRKERLVQRGSSSKFDAVLRAFYVSQASHIPKRRGNTQVPESDVWAIKTF